MPSILHEPLHKPKGPMTVATPVVLLIVAMIATRASVTHDVTAACKVPSTLSPSRRSRQSRAGIPDEGELPSSCPPCTRAGPAPGPRT
jgi:hypothetical protein